MRPRQTRSALGAASMTKVLDITCGWVDVLRIFRSSSCPHAPRSLRSESRFAQQVDCSAQG